MKFIVTQETARLGRWLRILGFDTRITGSVSWEKVVILAVREARVLVSRSRRPVEGVRVARIFVSSDRWKEQLREVFRACPSLGKTGQIFSRCVKCNSALKEIDRRCCPVELPERVARRNAAVKRCPRCGKIYWKGTHETKVLQALRDTLKHGE
ncbi:MAG: hypothetical protein GF333_01450 [Candidatus Omnitrophica bacterium]|nr:hypothetical protein [Candidatus Omnitrophota bacterium]